MKRRTVTLPLALVAVFILLNPSWFSWRHTAYCGFAEGMIRTDMASTFFPTYAGKGGDGFDYTVKYPDHLSITGNLALVSGIGLL